MLDLVQEGIKLGEEMAALPWRAAYELLGEKNPTFGKGVKLAEGLVTLPFKMASEVVESMKGEASDVVQTAGPGAYSAGGPGVKSAGGPGLQNLLVNPGVTVLSDQLIGPGPEDRRALFRVTGLLCFL